MIILIDNYDSFTYNLVQYFGDLKQNVHVYRNDELSAQDVISKKPERIVISPGPSDPDHAGICLDVVKQAYEHNIPLLGVCLGHQSIGQAFGGNIIRAPKPLHGKISKIKHENTDIFEGLENPITVTRYHSLIIEKDTLPDCLSVTSYTDDDIIMGVAHKDAKIYGVQFHPESIATQQGHKMLENFLNQ